MFKYIDAHAHVNFPNYNPDRGEVIERAHKQGIAMINVGTTLESSRDIVALAEKYDTGVYAIVGMHPVHVRYISKNPANITDSNAADSANIADQNATGTADANNVNTEDQLTVDPYHHSYSEDFNEQEFEKIIAHPKVVGVGECGIDIFRLLPELDNEHDRSELLKLQEEVFRKQIQLAVKYDKPIMIHARESYKKILEILDGEFITHGAQLRGNAHFFAGTIEEAQAFIDRGFTVSFTGVITFAKQYEELIRAVPLDKMLSETDCPFVAPVPHRGERNEPAYVIEVVKAIAKIKDMDEEVVRTTLLENAKRQFKLDL